MPKHSQPTSEEADLNEPWSVTIALAIEAMVAERVDWSAESRVAHAAMVDRYQLRPNRTAAPKRRARLPRPAPEARRRDQILRVMRPVEQYAVPDIAPLAALRRATVDSMLCQHLEPEALAERVQNPAWRIGATPAVPKTLWTLTLRGEVVRELTIVGVTMGGQNVQT
jgi:hypothetical protein